MDLRTGKTYETYEEAIAAGVPESDIAEVIPRNATIGPEIKFKTGPFKNRIYRRNGLGNLVRIDK